MADNKDDWEDVPLDDWEDTTESQPVTAEPPQGMLERIMADFKSEYEDAKDIGQTGLDFASGAVKGLSMGSLDELGGLASAGIETGVEALGGGTGLNESFMDKYRGYQQASEQAQQEAADRSPWAEGLGQVGGGITGGMALGGLLGVGKAAKGAQSISEIAKNQGKAKAAMELLGRGGSSYLKAAPALAVESALTSKEQLLGDDANPMGVAADVGGSLAFGLPAVLGLEAASQVVAPSVKGSISKVKDKIASEFADEGNPRLRQLAKSFKTYGQDMEVSPRSHGADISGLKFSQRDTKAATNVLGSLDSADSKIGQQVGQSIEQATARGATVDISPDIQAAAQRVNDLAQEIPDLGSTRKSAAAFDKMLNGQPNLTPSEVKGLIDDIDAAIGTFKSATNKDAAAVGTLNELLKYRKSISETFKKAVPEYAQAAERFESFRNVLEQLVSGERPADITQTFYGNLRNQDQKVYDKIIDMIQNVQKTGQSSQTHRTAFTNFMDALEKFEAQESARNVDSVLPSSQSLRKFILDASDDAVLRGSVRSTTESRSITPDWKEWLIGKAPASGAFLAGKATKSAQKVAQKPIIQQTIAMSKAVYNAPAQAVSNLASKLETSGQFKSVGKALREAIENGDSAKKNAALFTIMQNPNSRAFISAEDFPDADQE
jgi:cell fate (sporulation/competence/biofilm development) regulator YlbF (YheA/YmcA/DUF963 family)